MEKNIKLQTITKVQLIDLIKLLIRFNGDRIDYYDVEEIVVDHWSLNKLVQ